VVKSASEREVLVEVLKVRVQNRNGVIFRGQRISERGEVLDAYGKLTARLHGRGVAVKVMVGQWWRLCGEIGSKTFISAGGFEMTEEHIEVERGNATLLQPSGSHIVSYLARNERFIGIGTETAGLLWRTFKNGLFEVLDSGDYQALADVVHPAKAAVLIEGWREEGLSKTLQWLQANGVGIAIGRRIISYFGTEAVEKINANPYRLLSFSAGWEEVDRLATKQLGIVTNDERRLAAAVEEVVYRRFSRGHTFVPRASLSSGLKDLLKAEGSRDVIEAAIEHCKVTGRLLFDLDGNAYSLGASILENRVVECIQQRSHILSPACDVGGIVKAFEDREGFLLNTAQKEAIRLVAEHHFSVITGGAGCGKTTVLKAVCEVLESQGYEVSQVALAGKAVKRMMEATGRTGCTVASFIKKLKDAKVNGGFDSAERSAVLIDEASMVDLISFAAIARQVRDDVKIALIGDPHQLPPVGPGLVLHCLPGTPGVPHVELKQPERFDSKMAKFANAVRDGILPEIEDDPNIALIDAADEEMASQAAHLFLGQPDDSVVLASTKELAATINQIVQSSLSAGKAELRLWNEEFECMEATGLREGDVVICTRNYWDLGIQNGSMGRLVTVGDAADALGEVEWDDGVVRKITIELLDDLELGYALTVHKAQGSQWSRVIVCLPAKSKMVDRSMVYTAITRTRKQVVILGKQSHVRDVVKREKAADRRNVGLPKRLARMYSNQPKARL
jgi:exodeoxyribonuclease V alpha subunit